MESINSIKIGLEIHVQVAIENKAFCSCRNVYGDEVNSHVCEQCSGQPGALPVLNPELVKKAVMAGLILGSEIDRSSSFDRKNYNYHDMPKGYQITQKRRPICRGGVFRYLSSEAEERSIRIEEMHIEEDSAKSIYRAAGSVEIDYNRSGVGLLEIVSSSEFRSGDEVGDFVSALRNELVYNDVCTGKMEEGVLRCDVNISRADVCLGDLRVEIKNLNSIRNIRAAIAYELDEFDKMRQSREELRESVTKRWSEANRKSIVMRDKGGGEEYRYLSEPDLVCLEISDSLIEGQRVEMKRSLSEVGSELKERYGCSSKELQTIFSKIGLVRVLEEVRDSYEGLSYEFWRILIKRLMGMNFDMETLSISEHELAVVLHRLCKLEEAEELSSAQARDILRKVCVEGEDLDLAIEMFKTKVFGEEDIREMIRGIVAEDISMVERYRSGKKSILGFVLGELMKRTKGGIRGDIGRRLVEDEFRDYKNTAE